MSQRGSVHRRGDVWIAYWRTVTANGRKQHTKSFRTKKEAQPFLNDTVTEIRDGLFSEPSKVTFGEFLTERWLPTKQMAVRTSTYASYRAMVERHLEPALGMSLSGAHRRSARPFLRRSRRQGPRHQDDPQHPRARAPGTPRRRAQEPDLSQRRRPAEAQRADRAETDLDPDQLRLFFEGVAPHRLTAAYTLAATTGMRRGEMLGVRWRDIDFKARRLHVEQTVLSVEYQITIGWPKTLRGERQVALDPQTVRVLNMHRAAQRRERQLLGDGYRDQGLVFARENGDPIHPDYFSQTFDRTVKRLKPPKIRLHDLRHTHAKVISDRLGHSTTSFTQDIYMHAIATVEDAAADQIADLIFTADDGEGDDDDDDDPQPAPAWSFATNTGQRRTW